MKLDHASQASKASVVLPPFKRDTNKPAGSQEQRKIDWNAGVTIMRCKSCKKKFGSYGTALCGNCRKEK